MDCGSNQLLLASAMRCELGAWAILSRAASGAGDGLFVDVFVGCPIGGLLAYAFGFAVVGEAIPPRPQRLKPDRYLATYGMPEGIP